jgi:hypothetical protein
MRGKLHNLIGEKFGKLIVVSYLGKSYWLCHCDCGKEKKVFTSNLKRVKSCGCYNHSKEWSEVRRKIVFHRKKKELTEKVCKGCQKVFSFRYGNKQFCNRKCHGLWMSRELSRDNSPNWKGGNQKCLECGIELSSRNNKLILCKKCVGKMRRGCQYDGLPRRNDWEYKRWRMKVFKRDLFKCRIDNGKCSGKIVAHHILGWSFFPELRYEVNNGITLCQTHHPLKRVEEKRLVPVFRELVLTSNVNFG